MDKDTVLLLAGRASRLENQDAIDEAIVSMLADPREVEIFLLRTLYYKTIITFLEVFLIQRLFICRHVQTLEKSISCHSIPWTNVLQ